MFEIYTTDGADGLMDYLGVTWMPAVQRTVRLLWSAPKPLIAAYNGSATAGGLDFGLSCDVRLAARSARFAESYVNLGMVPVAGGAYLLPMLIGLPAATRMIASGAFIDAEEALRLGMVAEVCDDDALVARAHEVALEMTHGPSATFARAKNVARAAATVELEAALRGEPRREHRPDRAPARFARGSSRSWRRTAWREPAAGDPEALPGHPHCDVEAVRAVSADCERSESMLIGLSGSGVLASAGSPPRLRR